ncbi:MAG: acyl-CoA dehydrogenase family protein [Clostridiales bacterium]|nr:acyl-CoA dehydrogenase family protein [Clostridiales bacterium]MDD6936192.1 acyl-CoA dehydrogenase family protein [Clostridiales bacterium]MDY2961520.1 acyl-CoA dehydrogenase family protein [Oscillospiraceae bacterium]
MIDFSLTEEQELLLEQVEEFMKRGNYDEYFKECDRERKFPEKACKDFVEAGFHCLDYPQEYGGEEVDLVTIVLMKMKFFELGWPVLTLPGGNLEIDNILTYGTKEQQDTIIGLAKSGIKPYTLGFTEPQAGSDNSAMTTRATHKDGKVYINGHKTFNTFATVSPYMMCIAREYENLENPYKDMSWYLVPLNAPGVKISVLDKVGCHCMPTCEVYLDNVEVEESALVGTRGKGFYQLMKNFETERLFTCISNVGMAQCAYNDAVAYAGTRVQFNKTIGEFQIIQEKITDMKIKCDNMVNMLLKCAWKKQRGESISMDASLLKRYTGKAAFEVIDDAMQIMGGIGYTNDCRIARLWRDQRGARIYAGTEEVMVHSSARSLIKEALKAAAK